ncbi:MAG TPA: enoyl-CoA hydratase/isomerase family protein [Acidimicrobiales bacterium]|nr:enoyl-CoA hydratase/isomerase family protein [Acidimicrobiales bacterium]
MAAGSAASAAAPDGVVAVDRRDDGVVLVTIDRPKANALSVSLLGRLADAVDGLGAEPPGAVVLWGGTRIFAAGADVAEFTAPDGAARIAAARIAAAFGAATGALAALGCPTVAAVAGVALGGGLELALACDLRVASEDARLGQPEILLGLIPGGGATQRLPRLVGPGRAKDLIWTGRQVGAGEALGMGLVDRLVPRGAVLDEALALAASLAAGPRLAVRAAKEVIDAGADLTLARSLALEVEAFVAVAGTEDARSGVASFLEHGPGRARFGGR